MKRGTKNLLMILSGLLAILLVAVPVAAIAINLPALLDTGLTEETLITIGAAILIPVPLIVACYKVYSFAKSEPDVNMANEKSRKSVGMLLIDLGKLFEAEAILWFFVVLLVPILMENAFVTLMIVLVAGLLVFFVLAKVLGRIGRYMSLSNREMAKARKNKRKKR